MVITLSITHIYIHSHTDRQTNSSRHALTPFTSLIHSQHSLSTFTHRAFLRILYAKNEAEITRHGYTPFTLQHAGSVLSAEIEMQVLKTMVGIVGVMLRVYGTDLETDMTVLRTGKINYDDESKVAGGMSMLTVSSDDIISEVHRILRTIFRMQSPHVSTTILHTLPYIFSVDSYA